jgi:hypothetical protein
VPAKVDVAGVGEVEVGGVVFLDVHDVAYQPKYPQGKPGGLGY